MHVQTVGQWGFQNFLKHHQSKKIVQSNIRLLPVVEGSLLEPEYFPCPNQLEHTRREYMKQT